MIATLGLGSGLTIAGVGGKFEGLMGRWYEVYDAVRVPRDNTLRPEEIALCVMMNSRMSGNTGLAIWQRRERIEQALAEIPSEADLSSDTVPWEGLTQLLDVFEEIPRAKLGVATKILHKKRPSLLPMFDEYVRKHYHCQLKVRAATLGGYAVNLLHEFREDLIGAGEGLAALCAEAERRGRPVTRVRMLDHLVWAHLTEPRA